MAEKKIKKQRAHKLIKKTSKAPARKTPSKAKPKKVQQKKTVSKKSVSQKTVQKKTAVKAKGKPAAHRKTTSRQRQAVRKPSPRRKPKFFAKSSTPSATRQPRKSAARMTEEERKAGLRKSLIQKREEIVKEVKSEISKYIKGETRQLVDTALDDGDWSVVDLSEDISFKHMSTHRENLLKIDEALRKLSEGTYGICEDCGDEISEQRLKILPFAIYCTDCQEHREQIEELGKREGFIG